MRPVFAAILCLTALGAATRPEAAKPPESIAQLREDARQRAQSQWSQLPLLPTKRLPEMLRFRMSKGWLVAESPLYDGKDANYRIGISDLDGVGNLRFKYSRFPGAYYIFLDFYDFTHPELVTRHLDLIRTPISLLFGQEEAPTDTGEFSVSVVETIDPGADAPVTLRVQSIDQGPGLNVVLTGNNFSDLRRNHPAEFERYLRPLMRSFQAEPVGFGVDDQTAWQVLSDTWRAPPDLPAKVEAIIVRLNADDYAARAAAQKDLDQLGEPAALYFDDLSLH